MMCPISFVPLFDMQYVRSELWLCFNMDIICLQFNLTWNLCAPALTEQCPAQTSWCPLWPEPFVPWGRKLPVSKPPHLAALGAYSGGPGYCSLQNRNTAVWQLKKDWKNFFLLNTKSKLQSKNPYLDIEHKTAALKMIKEVESSLLK